jgi:hypothetical protein
MQLTGLAWKLHPVVAGHAEVTPLKVNTKVAK